VYQVAKIPIYNLNEAGHARSHELDVREIEGNDFELNFIF